ncbi:hypothetical protein FPCIR_11385 [Fusarium pseudocircinatum]|uniref:Uncharacterized protein n=1 Tax=Fusarium pseudocircinatum TaxID=56676 RepID=A0A8H5KQX6_9HYPO|nr:hypothetical protein FPCIR_11385 [Fusarium pseudocircinatum]
MRFSSIFSLAICLLKTTKATPTAEGVSEQRLSTIELEIGKTYAPGEIQKLQLSALQNHAVNATQQGKSIQKREILHAALNAKINFYCPNLRNTQREFEWVAYWYSQSNRLQMVGTKDIDGFRNFSFDSNTGKFAGYWYHSFCLATPTKLCTYNVQAYFSGKKYTHFVMMEMVTDASSGANILAPVVTENCVDIHTNACPAAGVLYAKLASQAELMVDLRSSIDGFGRS